MESKTKSERTLLWDMILIILLTAVLSYGIGYKNGHRDAFMKIMNAIIYKYENTPATKEPQQDTKI